MGAAAVSEHRERLTAKQVARRARVVDAALELAAEGGYDAVQMRDVATRAGVALGTIYRYFSSKDELLAAALVEWAAVVEHRISARPPRGRPPATDWSTCCAGRLAAWSASPT